jgi:hypothetical protein
MGKKYLLSGCIEVTLRPSKGVKILKLVVFERWNFVTSVTPT